MTFKIDVDVDVDVNVEVEVDVDVEFDVEVDVDVVNVDIALMSIFGFGIPTLLQFRGRYVVLLQHPRLALSDGRADIDTTMFSDFLVKVYLFSKLWGVHLFVRLGLASDLIVHDIFTWGMSWTLHIELGFVHLNFLGLPIN